MSNELDFKRAYERQKLAREQADQLLENKSRELFDANEALTNAYQRLKEQKLQVLHQEKLASIGQLVAGVAHEINNPIAFIKSNLGTLSQYGSSLPRFLADLSNIKDYLEQCENDAIKTLQMLIEKHDLRYLEEDFSELIEESLEGIVRVENIVSGLKIFARQDDDEPELMDVNDCLRRTLKLVNSEIKYKAELRVELGDVPVTKGFPGSMSQVFLNLLVNAAHAMDEFGQIEISTVVENNLIKIVVSDTGCGMEPDVANKIFDPFFTTKEVGVGTGLGLSIAHGIVKKHKGSIQVDSELGKGTAFTLWLPIVPA